MNGTISGARILELQPAGDRAIEYAADMFMREYHEGLGYQSPEWQMQRARYIEFFDKVGLHLRQTANAYHKMADEALRISTPEPFVIPKEQV